MSTQADRKKTQPSAQATEDARTRILASARAHFVKTGFSATSISCIAKDASVSRSLIFHHFENKSLLWQAVKDEWLGEHWSINEEDKTIMQRDLDGFLDVLINKRFAFYQKNPDYFKLHCWQAVDPHASELNHACRTTIKSCLDAIKALQKKKCIRRDMDGPTLLTPLLVSAYAPLLLKHTLPLKKKQQKHYLDLMCASLKAGLLP